MMSESKMAGQAGPDEHGYLAQGIHREDLFIAQCGAGRLANDFDSVGDPGRVQLITEGPVDTHWG